MMSSTPTMNKFKKLTKNLVSMEEYGQDCVEYVHFGKGLEYDGERRIWEEDVDFWSEMSRRFSPSCRFI